MIKTAFWGAALGVVDRLVLSDRQWDRISGVIVGRPDQRGSTGRNNRMFVEGVLWIVRTGAPWRDLPPAFCVSGAARMTLIFSIDLGLQF
jgi:putative transposase